MKNLLIFTFVLFTLQTKATTWLVGASQTYTLPSQLTNLVQDNDTIRIDGGVYLNDWTKWKKKNLVIIGLGNSSNRTILRSTVDIPNGKGIFVFETAVQCDNAYIENIVFDGAQVSDNDGANGAGIRFQARGLTIKNCKFINCQNGILEGNSLVSGSIVTITDSEFENNGYQLPNDPSHSGYEHHLYINASTSVFTMRNCYLHHPRGQANSIKTRALSNYIEYNLIDEGDTGYGSYELNIAQGGLCVIIGNTFIQGTSGANHSIVGYDAVTNPEQDFYFINNTVINKYVGNVKLFNISPSSGIQTFKVYNTIFASVPGASNTFFGTNTPSVLDSMGNRTVVDYNTFGFVDPSLNNFNLTSAALSAIDLGVNPGMAGSYALNPVYAYNNFSSTLSPRITSGSSIDIGAYELPSQIELSENQTTKFIIYPNPTEGKITIDAENDIESIEIYALNATLVAVYHQPKTDIFIEKKGFFYFKVKHTNQQISIGKICVK